MEGKIALVAGNLGKLKNDKFILDLGGYIAKYLADEGANVIVIDLEEGITKSCVKHLGHTKIKAKTCDLLKDRAYETKNFEEDGRVKTDVIWTDSPAHTLIKEIIDEYGKLDALVTNFDYYEKEKILDITEESYAKMRELNVIPVFHLLAAVREQFSAQTKTTGSFAKVVILTNMVGKAGLNMAAVYSAFKASMIGLTKNTAREFGRFASVNAVAMAPLGGKSMQGPKERAKKVFALITSTAMGNLSIMPEHITPLVGFLCSDGAAAITGQTISIDGGLWLKLEQ
ncbi:MAG: SDR family oxidoreductase [Candidatus Lokiarchaeota archaeon]|nr:SDR family oxidoreductase [Candidatus Lokiarchaeota archaeon]